VSKYKNINNMDFYRLFEANTKLSLDSILNNRNDLSEQKKYSKNSGNIYGIVVSGRQAHIDSKTTSVLANQNYYKDLGDGIARATASVKILPHFQESSDHLPDAMIEDIFTDYMDDVDKEIIIKDYKEATSFFGDLQIESLVYGSLVSMIEIDEQLFILRNISNPVIFDGLANLTKFGSMMSFQNGSEFYPESNVVLSVSQKQSVGEFIEKIKASPSFSDFTAASLAGVVANASHETGGTFRGTIGGDPPSYWKDRDQTKYKQVMERAIKGYGFNTKKEKYYCSWGYWQLQVCSNGSGSRLAESKGIDVSTEEGKQAWAELIAVDENQFEWVASVLKGKSLHNLADATQAGTRICTDFERPANRFEKCPKRGATAAAIFKEFSAKLSE